MMKAAGQSATAPRESKKRQGEPRTKTATPQHRPVQQTTIRQVVPAGALILTVKLVEWAKRWIA